MAIARDVGDDAPDAMATATFVAVERAEGASGATATVTAGARVMEQGAVASVRATATFAPIARVGKGGAPGAMAGAADAGADGIVAGTAEPGDDAPSLISSVADGAKGLWWVALGLLAAYVAWRVLRGRVREWLGGRR